MMSFETLVGFVIFKSCRLPKMPKRKKNPNILTHDKLYLTLRLVYQNLHSTPQLYKSNTVNIVFRDHGVTQYLQ